MSKLTQLARDTRGATMVEYIVIVALIFLVSIAAWKKIGDQTKLRAEEAGTALENAKAPAGP